MSYILCDKVRNLEPYQPIEGQYRIRLDANESFYGMPEVIKEEFKTIIDTLEDFAEMLGIGHSEKGQYCHCSRAGFQYVPFLLIFVRKQSYCLR